MDPRLTTAGAVVAAIALFFALRALLRQARLEPVATLAVAPEHRLELPAGELVLHLAGPFGKRGLGELSFALVDAAGNATPSMPIVMRSSRSSPRWGVLLAVRRFVVASPGACRLTIAGIPADRDLSDCAVVLARPQGAGLAVAIVAVVLSAVALVACTVLSALLWLSPSALAGLQSAT